jgi:thymidine kinase
MKDKVRIKSYKRIINSNCAEIIQILKFQVLTTLIAVDGLQFYKDKILKVDNSLKKKSNYAVVLVGFDGLN